MRKNCYNTLLLAEEPAAFTPVDCVQLGQSDGWAENWDLHTLGPNAKGPRVLL